MHPTVLMEGQDGGGDGALKGEQPGGVHDGYTTGKQLDQEREKEKEKEQNRGCTMDDQSKEGDAPSVHGCVHYRQIVRAGEERVSKGRRLYDGIVAQMHSIVAHTVASVADSLVGCK